MSITFITGNKDKFAEAKLFIDDLVQSDIDLVEIQGINSKVIIAAKLEEARKVVGGEIIVEDTSLYLDCMNGLPGPLIRWFMKTIGNEGLVKIAKSFGNNRAIAKVMIGYGRENGEMEYFEASMNGEIVEMRGENGFGWDTIFQPEGWTKTFAEMTTEEKNGISMRREAFLKLKEFLNKK